MNFIFSNRATTLDCGAKLRRTISRHSRLWVILVSLFFLFFLSKTSRAQGRAQWIVGNRTFYLARANLHSHTQYSDAKDLGHQETTNPWSAFKQAAQSESLDVLAATEHGGHLSTLYRKQPLRVRLLRSTLWSAWVETREPLNIGDLKGCLWGTNQFLHYVHLNRATKTGPNTYRLRFSSATRDSDPSARTSLLFQDHLFLSGEWEDMKWKADTFCQRNVGKHPPFIALRGFEWTDGADLRTDFVDNSYAGHINVFGSHNYCDARLESDGRLLTSRDENFWTRADTLHNRSALSEFYAWIGRETAVAPDLVCQFNHPTLYDKSNHFQRFDAQNVPPAIRERFALIEMGTETVTRQGFYEGGGDGRNPDTSNEYWFRRALWKGWRVAPTNNGDNHFGSYAKKPQRTGIWCESPQPTQQQILRALRARRTFATENTAAIIQFSARSSLNTAIMGETLKSNSNGAITFSAQIKGSDGQPAKIQIFRLSRGGIAGPDMREVIPVSREGDEGDAAARSGNVSDVPTEDTICYYARFTIGRARAYSAPIWIQLLRPPPSSVDVFASNSISQTDFKPGSRRSSRPTKSPPTQPLRWPRLKPLPKSIPPEPRRSMLSMCQTSAPAPFPAICKKRRTLPDAARSASWRPNKMLLINASYCVLFNGFDQADSLLTQLLMIVAGCEAGSLWHSQELNAKAAEPRQLVIIDGATHMDLYDGEGADLPADKLAPFFKGKL